jgi:TonB-dependent SusC/RagA subfamily outer membrane receptor
MKLNPISILKDNAATAVYGSKGAYGVILITTKKGKAGKAAFNYTTSFNWSSPTGFPKDWMHILMLLQ